MRNTFLKRDIITVLLPQAMQPFFFTLSRGEAVPPFRRLAAAGEIGCRWAGRALPPPGGGGKRDRDTKVSLPLLTPLTFLRTRLPSVARLNARGPQGRLVLQGSTLDGSGAFRSVPPPPCTVWPRTVMRGGLRKVNSGHNSVPKPARRTEPSPRFSRFAARPQGVAAQRRVWGSQEGAREPYGALAPFCLRRQTAAMPGLPIGSHLSPPAAHRCIGGRSAVSRR